MGAEPSSRLAGIAPAGWLPLSHAEAIRAVDGLELTALSDTDEARLRRAGERYGVTALFADADAMLADVRPDLVMIATRTPGKAELVRRAVAAGARIVYVEKPLANGLSEARSALSAAADAGAIIGYGVNRRYHSVYRSARRLLREGVIGTVRDVVVEHGRRQLLWCHPHSVDLMLFLLGSTRVESIQARLEGVERQTTPSLVIDADPVVEHAHFTFADGTTGTIVRNGGWEVRIGGDAGTLTIHADGSYLQLSRPRGESGAYFLDQTFLHDSPVESATVVALRELLAAARGIQPPPIAAEEIECGLRMLFGCVWSHAHDGRPIHAADVPEQLVVTGRAGTLYA